MTFCQKFTLSLYLQYQYNFQGMILMIVIGYLFTEEYYWSILRNDCVLVIPLMNELDEPFRRVD